MRSVAPKAFVQNKFVSVSLNDALSIDCFVEAFPRADSFWSRAELIDNNRFKKKRLTNSNNNTNNATSAQRLTAFFTDTKTTSASDFSQTTSLNLNFNSSADSRSYVTVKQTAVNPYTYKLAISISKVQRSDFGRYLCLASNSLGSAEAQVVVKG